MKSNKNKQKSFFNKDKNQYSQNLILKPPLHTKFEIEKIIETLGNIKKNDQIIDFGAGSGRITIPLLQKKYKVISIDISNRSLIRLKKLALKLNLNNVNISDSLIKQKKIYAVVGADILHHVDMDVILSKLYLILKNGGKIVFSEPGAFNISWYIYLSLFYDWEVEKGMMDCTYVNLRNKLMNAGFKKITITGLGLLPRPLFNWSKVCCRFNDWLGNMPFLKLFAYRYIIEAVKL